MREGFCCDLLVEEITLHGGSFVAICFGLLGGVITQCGGHRLLWQEKENKQKEKGKKEQVQEKEKRERVT